MRLPYRFTLFVLLNGLIWAWSLAMLAQTTQSSAQSNAEYTVEFLAAGAESLNTDARQAITQAANTWGGTPPPTNVMTLIGLRVGSNWAIGTLTFADVSRTPATTLEALDETIDTQINPNTVIAVLLVEAADGWQAALDNDLQVQRLLEEVPTSELSMAARVAIFPDNFGLLRPDVLTTEQQFDGYKLPWPGGAAWARTQSWHGGTWSGRFPGNNSIDFDIINEDNADILASASGIVTHTCRIAGQQQAGIIIQTDGTSESLGYLHLELDSIPSSLDIGTYVEQGNIIGRMVEGTVIETCGYSYGTHLHLFLPTRPFSMDGYTFSDSDTQGGISLFSTQSSSGTLLELPQNDNVVRNGTFGGGINHWTAQLDTTANIIPDENGNRYIAWRGESGSAGVIAQMVNHAIPADSAVELTLDLGNSTDSEKRLRVHLHRHNGSAMWDDMLMCEFAIPADTPLQTYILRRRITTEWENARIWIEGWPADGQPNLLTDNVRLRRFDSIDLEGTECFSPTTAREWDFTDGQQGWTVGEAETLANPRPSTSGTAFTVTGDDAALLSPSLEGINATDYQYIQVEMASLANSCGRVYFQLAGQRTFTGAQSVTFAVSPDGAPQRYTVDMQSNALWNGEISRLRLDPACGDYDPEAPNLLILTKLRLTDVEPSLVLLSPDGTITQSDGGITYVWPDLPDVQAYDLYVSPSSDVNTSLFNQTIDAAIYCDGDLCRVDAPTVDPMAWLPNGEYTAFLRLRRADDISDWAGGFNFSVNVPVPASVTLQSLTGTRLTSRPTFNWQLNGSANNASWFEIYAAPQADQSSFIIYDWYSRMNICANGENPLCSLSASVDMANGNYVLYLRSWGPGGFSNWAGPLNYTIDVPQPTIPTALSVRDAASRRPIFSWQAADYVTWYEVWVGTPGPDWATRHQAWHYSGTMGCAAGGTCTIQPDLLLGDGDYVWYMRGWGAGGFTTGGVSGWAEGANFRVGATP